MKKITITAKDGKDYEITGTPVEKPTPRWRTEKDGIYWSMFGDGGVRRSTETGDDIDNSRYATGNYFKTGEEAKAYKEYLLALQKLKDAIAEVNGDWKPDWESDENAKKGYEIYWNFISEIWKISSAVYSPALQVFPHIKSKELAEQIIKDYEKELNIVRDYLFQ